MGASVRMLVLSALCAWVAADARADVNVPPSLAATRWQLVQVIGLDDQLTVPDEAWRYSVEFDATGRAFVHADCTQVMTTWTSAAAGHLQFGAFATTRAACAAGSLAPRALRELPNVRTYSIRDGHLYLASLDETAAIWEFSPLTP